jgi:hypothetical protein
MLMKTFPACAVLLVSLVGAGALFASGQVIASQQARTIVQKKRSGGSTLMRSKLSFTRTRKPWRNCGRMISSLPIP